MMKLDKFKIIDKSEIKKHASRFGNYDFEVTQEDLTALQNGKVLSFLDEYGIFVHMKEKETNKVYTQFDFPRPKGFIGSELNAFPPIMLASELTPGQKISAVVYHGGSYIEAKATFNFLLSAKESKQPIDINANYELLITDFDVLSSDDFSF